MSGRYMKLRPGKYLLKVPTGGGPAGLHRTGDGGVQVDKRGGQVAFDVPSEQRVYFWWRGPQEPTGLRIVGPSMAERGRGERGMNRIA